MLQEILLKWSCFPKVGNISQPFFLVGVMYSLQVVQQPVPTLSILILLVWSQDSMEQLRVEGSSSPDPPSVIGAAHLALTPLPQAVQI